MTFLRVVVITLGFAAVACVGCGGSDDRRQVQDTVKGYFHSFAAGDGAGACARLTDAEQQIVVQRLAPGLGNTSCPTGIEAVATQLSAADKARLNAVSVAQVTIDGSAATATLVGATQQASLTKLGGRWLISGGVRLMHDASTDHPPYLEVPMPERFVLEFQLPDGGWMDEALCYASDYVRNPDGSYFVPGQGGSLWIRAVRVEADGTIEHVDGTGTHHTYRLVALPSERYQEGGRPVTPTKPDSEIPWEDTEYHKLDDDYDNIVPTGRKPLPDGMVLDEIPEGMHDRHAVETREEADARGARDHPGLLEARQAAARRRG